jgi:hypothetical protein
MPYKKVNQTGGHASNIDYFPIVTGINHCKKP